MRAHFSLIVGVLLLTGCGGGATLSENLCVAGDWQTLGYRDGALGYRSSSLLEHQEDCVEHGIVPDRADYMLGWEEGMREYCTASNGFVVGELGRGHNNVCSEDLREAFLEAYLKGRKLYLARYRVNQLDSEIHQRNGRLEAVKAEIVSSAAGQLDGELTPTERVELLARTQRLADEKRELELRLRELEAEREVRIRERDALAQQVANAF